ncbi:MAG TPA: penicillin-binding protein 2 [Candidatus Limnocylindria bacterium]|nr:penicillin-binding protein 2 [Candidatus Limnocylindria bacterium]
MAAFRRFRVMPREVPPELVRRIMVVGAMATLGIALLISRLWFLQLIRGDQMRATSENNRIRLTRLPAARGLVYDRYGELLVDNRPSFDVVLVPEDARDRAATLDMLAANLKEPAEELDRRIRAPSRRPPYAGIVVERDVEWDDVVALETHQLELPGVSIQVQPRRTYPHGELASHLLGYVGEASDRELADDPRRRPGDIIGKGGLERVWDEELRGTAGGQQVEVDALGRRVRVLEEVPDVPGDTLILTIDRDLQAFAEQAMGDHRGAFVALDPRNGEILAMVSKPAYDPNWFARGIRASEWRQLTTDPWHPLTNRATQGTFAPGSIFKVAVAAGLLAERVVDRHTHVFCPGGTQFGNRWFRCWNRNGHGSVDLHTGIMQSCDVFFYLSGQRLGIDRLADYVRRFGLGYPTGVALPHEASGIIPDSDWKRRRFDAPWYPGETLSVAIGQGYVTVTPLQMAVVAATIANGGTRFRPQYVKRVEAPDGTLRREIMPEILGFADVDASVLEQVRAGMRDVVMSERGTGKRARVPGIAVAGKTGTAQVVSLNEASGKGGRERTRDHAWFIAYAPAEAPTVAVACLVEHAGGGGGAIAAPIVGQVLERYFHRTVGPAPPPAREVADARH